MDGFWMNRLEGMMSKVSGRIIVHADMTAILKIIYGSKILGSDISAFFGLS